MEEVWEAVSGCIVWVDEVEEEVELFFGTEFESGGENCPVHGVEGGRDEPGDFCGGRILRPVGAKFAGGKGPAEEFGEDGAEVFGGEAVEPASDGAKGEADVLAHEGAIGEVELTVLQPRELVDGEVFDGTVKSQLESMSQEMGEAEVI